MLIDNLSVDVGALESGIPTFGRFRSATGGVFDLAPATPAAALAAYLNALYLAVLGRSQSDQTSRRLLLRPWYKTQAWNALQVLATSDDEEVRDFARLAADQDFTETTGLPVATVVKISQRLELAAVADLSVMHLVLVALGDAQHRAEDVTVKIPYADGSLHDSNLGLVVVESQGAMMDRSPYWRLLAAIFLHDDALPVGDGSLDLVLRFVASTAMPLDPFALIAERRSGALEIPFANYLSLLLLENQLYSGETRRRVAFRNARDFITMARLRFFGSQDHAIADETQALTFLSALRDRGATADKQGLFHSLAGNSLLLWHKGDHRLVLPEDAYIPAFEAITLTEGDEDDPFGTDKDDEQPVDPTGKTKPDDATLQGDAGDDSSDPGMGDGGDAGAGDNGMGGDPGADPMADPTADPMGDPTADPSAMPGGDPADPNVGDSNNNMSLLIPSAGQGETADDYYYRLAVLNTLDAIERNPDVDFDADQLELLRTVCTRWLFRMDIESVKQLVDDLGLKSILRPFVEK